MKDSCSASMPFTFDDLSVEREGGSKAQFVNLFSSLEQGEELTEEGGTAEDQARKVFEDAYVQGEKAGYEMGMRKVESIAKRLEKQIGEIVSFKDELVARYEKLSTELALIFAEAIILKECSERREVLAVMIRKALEACEDRSELVIRVRTEDVKHVEGLTSDRLKLITDDTLKEPGFVIETNVGDIDGRISSQIDELKTALIGYHVG